MELQERRRLNQKIDCEAGLWSEAENLGGGFTAPTKRKLRNEVVEKISGGGRERKDAN
uniref:Uncharacterized protein n=1 Tax=Cucumis melo TaxID=3656 RepID=A0A9I9CNE2_CUCME